LGLGVGPPLHCVGKWVGWAGVPVSRVWPLCCVRRGAWGGCAVEEQGLVGWCVVFLETQSIINKGKAATRGRAAEARNRKSQQAAQPQLQAAGQKNEAHTTATAHRARLRRGNPLGCSVAYYIACYMLQ